MLTSATPRQREVLAFIQAFVAEHHATPRLRDIMDRFGFKSTNAAHQHVVALRSLGLLREFPKMQYGATVTVQPGAPPSRARHPFSPRAARYTHTEHVTFAKAAQRFGIDRADVASAYAELYPDHPRISV